MSWLLLGSGRRLSVRREARRLGVSFWAEPVFAMPPMVHYEGRKDTVGNGIQDFATLTAYNETDRKG